MNSLSRSAGGMPGPLSAMVMRATPWDGSWALSTTIVAGAVRGPAGDIAPRGHGLGPDERGHIIEDEHRAGPLPFFPLQRCRGGCQVQFAALARERQLLGGRLAPPGTDAAGPGVGRHPA